MVRIDVYEYHNWLRHEISAHSRLLQMAMQIGLPPEPNDSEPSTWLNHTEAHTLLCKTSPHDFDNSAPQASPHLESSSSRSGHNGVYRWVEYPKTYHEDCHFAATKPTCAVPTPPTSEIVVDPLPELSQRTGLVCPNAKCHNSDGNTGFSPQLCDTSLSHHSHGDSVPTADPNSHGCTPLRRELDKTSTATSSLHCTAQTAICAPCHILHCSAYKLVETVSVGCQTDATITATIGCSTNTTLAGCLTEHQVFCFDFPPIPSPQLGGQRPGQCQGITEVPTGPPIVDWPLGVNQTKTPTCSEASDVLTTTDLEVAEFTVSVIEPTWDYSFPGEPPSWDDPRVPIPHLAIQWYAYDPQPYPMWPLGDLGYRLNDVCIQGTALTELQLERLSQPFSGLVARQAHCHQATNSCYQVLFINERNFPTTKIGKNLTLSRLISTLAPHRGEGRMTPTTEKPLYTITFNIQYWAGDSEYCDDCVELEVHVNHVGWLTTKCSQVPERWSSFFPEDGWYEVENWDQLPDLGDD
eukprot:TRINITY_DN67111_c0_g1_i1.p1 TRINITY_DN67111_c0_g1~~TRINITY_DN67111_c0_g1_i1.p1  ORF type:complete len:523 (+),score=20.50 TRINITY_DN67111_c0_g1_i1:87-1655(+)